MIEIFPITTKDENLSENLKWNFTYLSIFLNNLTNYRQKSHGFIKENNNSCSFHFYSIDDSRNEISNYISNGLITVKVSKFLLIKLFNIGIKLCATNIGAWNRIKKSYSVAYLLHFSKTYTEFSCGSYCFYYKNLLFVNSKFDFSKSFHYFAKRICNFGIPFNFDTEQLINYSFLFTKKKNEEINKIEDLNNLKFKGYSKFLIQKKN